LYKTSSELKREAKNALKGRWGQAILLNLVPAILRAVVTFFSVIAIVFSVTLFSFVTDSFTSTGSHHYEQTETFWEDGDIVGVNDFMPSDGTGSWRTTFNPAKLVFDLVLSFLTIGISYTFLDVIRSRERKIDAFRDAFRVFNGVDFVPLLLINILMTVFTTLWSLLLVIPGIVKGYSYSQSNFIYKDLSSRQDVQSMGATSYITESRLLMDGHKGRLFYIDLSFIGWHILCLMTFGLGYIFLEPYMNATKAAFYNDLAKDRYTAVEQVEEVIEEEEEWTSF